MLKDKLIKLDFTPGIRARDINHNFEVLHGSLMRERQRVGGTGLVDGFDLSANLDNFTVTVGKGVLINKEGEEVEVEETTFYAGSPEYISREDRLVCPEDGIITLSSIPYSPSGLKRVKYVPPYDTILPDRKEFSVECKLENRTVPYLQIKENKLYVSHPDYWRGKELTINYFATSDRVDAILLSEQGVYKYEKSIVADSPSHVDLRDYQGGYMMVGVIHWIIGESVRALFYTNHRSYRNIYVDEDGVLYLNGKPYREPRVIYFKEPEDPEENDMWYDVDNRVLLIYSNVDGRWGWEPVNDFSTVTMRETKMWTPEDWPEDNQTFIFGKDDMNLNFVPNTNALEIYIDNAVLMSDQYVEIVSSKHKDAPDYMSQGVGFKLKEPMDRPTYLQLVVNHRVRTSPVRETFQRAAVFVAENHAYMTEANSEQIFKTEYPYVIGARQLECWVDGIKLVPEIELTELKEDKTIPDEEEIASGSVMSHFFNIKKKLEPGQLIDHKISKHIWNYDQVSLLLENMKTDILGLQESRDEIIKNIDDMSVNTANQINSLSEKANNLNEKVNELDKRGFPEKSVGLSHLSDEVREAMTSCATFNTVFPAMEIEPIEGFTSSDFVIVNLFAPSGSQPLMKDVDYTLTDTEEGLVIELSPEYVAADSTIYATGFKLGK